MHCTITHPKTAKQRQHRGNHLALRPKRSVQAPSAMMQTHLHRGCCGGPMVKVAQQTLLRRQRRSHDGLASRPGPGVPLAAAGPPGGPAPAAVRTGTAAATPPQWLPPAPSVPAARGPRCRPAPPAACWTRHRHPLAADPWLAEAASQPRPWTSARMPSPGWPRTCLHRRLVAWRLLQPHDLPLLLLQVQALSAP